MNNQEHFDSMDDDDSIQLETSVCTIELMHDGGQWPKDLMSLAELIARGVENSLNIAHSDAVTRHLIAMPKSHPHINILLSNDENIKRLNLEFRGKDQPTNVLSFPVGDDTALGPVAGTMLGDIVLGYETVATEARDQGLPLNNHILHLVVHGALHLLGLDHQENDEATIMEGLETRILSMMNISDPYTGGHPAAKPDHASGEGQ